MATKISQLVSGSPASALDGSEGMEVTQGGVTKGATMSQILAYVEASIAGTAANIPAQRYTIDTGSTADSDPGAGLLKFNHAAASSATEIYIDDSTSDAVDLSTFFGSLAATGWLKLQSVEDAGEWMIFRWSAVTDGTGYFKFTVAHQASKGTLDDADEVLVTFDSDANTGGGGGTELKGLTFTSDIGDTTDSDPGAGLMKWNHATQGSATKLFFDNTTLDSITITSFFAALGTNGLLFMQQGDDPSRWQLWEIDTATADSGYYDFAVTLLAKSSSDIEDNKTVYCAIQKGPGSGGGSTQGLHDVHIAAGSMFATVLEPATFITENGASGQPDASYWSFDPTTEQSVWFAFEAPKSWDESTFTFHAQWKHPSTATNFGVVWSVRAVAMGDDDTFAVGFGTAQTSTDTGGTTGDLYVSPESAAITPAGAPATRDYVVVEVRRKPGNASDTLAVAAHLLGVTIQISTNADTDA
jgi:hypothetical protein